MSIEDLNKFEQFFTKYEENGFIANSKAFPLFIKCKLDEKVINKMYAARGLAWLIPSVRLVTSDLSRFNLAQFLTIMFMCKVASLSLLSLPGDSRRKARSLVPSSRARCDCRQGSRALHAGEVAQVAQSGEVAEVREIAEVSEERKGGELGDQRIRQGEAARFIREAERRQGGDLDDEGGQAVRAVEGGSQGHPERVGAERSE